MPKYRCWLIGALLAGPIPCVAACSTPSETGEGLGGAPATGGASAGGGEDAAVSVECDGVGAAAGIPEPIVWGVCSDPPPGVDTAECATLSVPRDYADPSGAQYRLDLMRIPVKDPAARTGSVVLHNGGPGGIATDFLRKFGGGLSTLTPLADEKDWVAMDTRANSESTRPRWFTDGHIELLRSVDRTPNDEADWQVLDAAYRTIADAALAAHSPAELATLGTRDTVRDMARLSAALGDDRIDYFGFSYGTLVGATFAGTCPSRVGHFALDAAVAPVPDFLSWRAPEARNLDAGLAKIAEACASDPTCPLHRTTGAEVIAARQALVDVLESSGGIAVGSRTIVESDLHYATRSPVWSGDGEPLWTALAAAESGDWAPLLQLADEYWERKPDGSYDNSYWARSWSISLNDMPCPEGFDLEAGKEAIAQASEGPSSIGAAMMSEILICLHWPVLGPALTVNRTSAPPLLVVAGNLDVPAPFENGPALVELLDNGSYLLPHDQPGHVGIVSNGCVRESELRFLVDGQEPLVDHCSAE